jgi:hypothetical protein
MASVYIVMPWHMSEYTNLLSVTIYPVIFLKQFGYALLYLFMEGVLTSFPCCQWLYYFGILSISTYVTPLWPLGGL